MTSTFEARLKAQALGMGFDLAGIATLGPADTTAEFERWLANGYHGEMDYLARGAELRRDSRSPEPGMRSALVVALDYGGKEPAGPVARYARGDDYHRLMWDRLEELLDWARAEWKGGADATPGATDAGSPGDGLRGRAYVDTGPILERDLARRAGLGWVGKNTMLINPQRGSFFFLGALFVDVELVPDTPFASDHCGTCTRCLEACPTQAFAAPRVLDARRCISYLTIEHRSDIPEPLAPLIGEHLYGCDVCQDVCPWNARFAQELKEPAFAARDVIAHKSARALADVLLEMDDESYRTAFKGSAMRRAKLAGLRRNAAVVRRNLAR
ncbi:MAG TPA: tRNA epoxyqueuosine(34) reductase QueG [Gemmatimonadaceae bacterium]|nr:tRNA epoxyqueuosine(34) reductase QueG [Gemmatimonadaceae bacterium]